MIQLLVLHFLCKRQQAQNGMSCQETLTILSRLLPTIILIINVTLLSRIGDNGKELTGFGQQLKICTVYWPSNVKELTQPKEPSSKKTLINVITKACKLKQIVSEKQQIIFLVGYGELSLQIILEDQVSDFIVRKILTIIMILVHISDFMDHFKELIWYGVKIVSVILIYLCDHSNLKILRIINSLLQKIKVI